jgi:hypothetical protein
MRGLHHTAAAALAALLLSAPGAFGQFDEGVKALDANDYGAAMSAWQAAAEGGDARSQYAVGYLYQFGLGVPADLAKAKEWYGRAAAQNNGDALYALGLLSETGKLGPKDLKAALDFYRRGAEAGQPDAEYALGRMSLRGRGTARDAAESIKWLKKAAAHGQPAAQFMLGASYEAGWGVEPNLVEAYYWYSRSLEADEAELHEQDMAFQPKIALASIRKHLSDSDLRRVEARLKADRASARPPAAGPGTEKPKKTAKPPGSPKDALTAQP